MIFLQTPLDEVTDIIGISSLFRYAYIDEITLWLQAQAGNVERLSV